MDERPCPRLELGGFTTRWWMAKRDRATVICGGWLGIVLPTASGNRNQGSCRKDVIRVRLDGHFE